MNSERDLSRTKVGDIKQSWHMLECEEIKEAVDLMKLSLFQGKNGQNTECSQLRY